MNEVQSALRKMHNFDEKSRSLVEKNLEDEKVHIKRWEESIKILKGQR